MKKRIHKYFCLHCQLKIEASEQIENLNCLACCGTLVKIPHTQQESIELLATLSSRFKVLQCHIRQMQRAMASQEEKILHLQAQIGRESLHHEI